jgi:hypothetical protein
VEHNLQEVVVHRREIAETTRRPVLRLRERVSTAFSHCSKKCVASSRPAGPLTNFNVGALELRVFSNMAPNLRAFRVMFVRACVRVNVTFFAAERRHLDYYSLHSFEPQ